MKIHITILFFASMSSLPAFGQEEFKILLTEGEIHDTTATSINGKHFGFRIDFKQGDNDTCNYEFILANRNVGLSRLKVCQIGKQEQFFMTDIRRVKPGDRLIFNIQFRGKKIHKSFHVLSTKASENIPYFFNVHFIYKGDTLDTNSYQVFLGYPKDSVHTKTITLARDTSNQSIKYFFSHKSELPKYIYIVYKNHQLVYDFIGSNFLHGDFFLEYTETLKGKKKKDLIYNTAIDFFDRDTELTTSQFSFK